MKHINKYASNLTATKNIFYKQHLKEVSLKSTEAREKEFLQKTKLTLEKYSIDYPSTERTDLTERCIKLEKRVEDIRRVIERTKELKSFNTDLTLPVEVVHEPEVKIVGQDSDS